MADDELSYAAFGALVGMTRQRVAQLVRAGRLALPLTVEQAASYARGPAAPPMSGQERIYAAVDDAWRSAAEIAARAGRARVQAHGMLLALEARGLIERRTGPIHPANNHPTVFWRRKNSS